MDREEVVRRVRALHLPFGEYWVTAGSGLVLFGIRAETADIDMGCTPALADRLIAAGAKWGWKGSDRRIELEGDIEIYENWNVDEIVELEGLSVASLLSIRTQKEALGREKDFADIRLIDEALKTKGSGVERHEG